MKILLIAISLLILASCQLVVGTFPDFPERVKTHYVLDVEGVDLPEYLTKAIVNYKEMPRLYFYESNVNCLKFDIVSKIPYKIKYLGVVPIQDCSGVGGYQPRDFIEVTDWLDDVKEWADQRKKCFR